MNHQIPDPLLRAAQSLGGQLVTNRAQVPDADIVVALSIVHAASPTVPLRLVFIFPDGAQREEFKRYIIRSYEDPSLIEPWHVAGYLSQPAIDYFNTSGGSEGSSGPVQTAMNSFEGKRKDG